jgi:hypothetical protein
VLYLRLIIFLVEDDITVDNETLLVIDFVNLKIKSTQSFGGAHKGSMCVHVFIRVSTHTYISIYICTVFLKKIGEGVCCFCLQVMKYNKILWDILL